MDDRGSYRRRPALRATWIAAVGVSLGLATACASDIVATPPALPERIQEAPAAAPTGARIGVVLPPSDAWHPEMIEEMRRDLSIVRATGREHVHQLVSHAPDSGIFLADLIGYVAAQGLDLTCALTTGSSSIIRQQHADLPRQRFCALVTTELSSEEADGFDLMVLKTGELGHVVGVAAAAASQEAVGYVLAADDLERGRFRDGLVAALAAGAIVDTNGGLSGVEAAVAAVADGADVVVIGGGPWAEEAAVAVVAVGAKVVVPEAIARFLDDDDVVATWRIQWHRVLRGPVDRLLEREAAAPLIQGVAQGPFVVRVGAAAPLGVNAAVSRAIRELSDASRDPLQSREPPVPVDEADEE